MTGAFRLFRNADSRCGCKARRTMPAFLTTPKVIPYCGNANGKTEKSPFFRFVRKKPPEWRHLESIMKTVAVGIDFPTGRRVVRDAAVTAALRLRAAGEQRQNAKDRRKESGGPDCPDRSGHLGPDMGWNRLYSFISSDWKTTVAPSARTVSMIMTVKNFELNTLSSPERSLYFCSSAFGSSAFGSSS